MFFAFVLVLMFLFLMIMLVLLVLSWLLIVVVVVRGGVGGGVVIDGRVVVDANVVQAAFVETHLHDMPVVAHPGGGKINTKVAWRELSQVVFLVNGSRYGTGRHGTMYQ